MTLPSVALREVSACFGSRAGRQHYALAVFAVVENGDTIPVLASARQLCITESGNTHLGQVREFVGAHLKPMAYSALLNLRYNTHLAASQVVLRWVGRLTVPNCVSYVALSEWILRGNSTVLDSVKPMLRDTVQ